MHHHGGENSVRDPLGQGVVVNETRFRREVRRPGIEGLERQRIELDRFRVLAALEIESRAAKETELVGAIDMVVGERGVVPRQHVPVEF